MRIIKRWSLIWALALGIVAPSRVLADDAVPADSSPAVYRLPQVMQVASWATEESAPAQPVPGAPGGICQTPAAGCCDSGYAGNCYGLFALVEGTFFWPQLHRPFISSSFSNTLGAQTFDLSSQNGGVNGSFLAAPRVTLGVQGQCWGLLTRYWNAQTWNNAFAPIPILTGGDPTTGITSFDGFKAYTFDIEVQRRFCLGCWNLYGFLGGRYASVNNSRSINIVNAFNGDILSSGSFASQSFNGTGVSFGAWGYSPLWDCCPTSLYFVNRFSILWGTGKAGSQARASVTSPTTSEAEDAVGLASTDHGQMFIYELQIGLQWMSQLQCLPACVFLRSGFEYQYWCNSQGLSTGATALAFIGPQTASASAAAGDMIFSLVGFNIGAGIMY